jgi:hypothetical protein
MHAQARMRVYARFSLYTLYFTGCFGLDECYNFYEREGAKKVNWDIPTDKISQDMLHSDHLFCTCP